MKSKEPQLSKALVTVLEDIETANQVVKKLRDSGVALEKLELVTHDVQHEAPEIETPITGETTASQMAGFATKEAGFGAGIGAAAGLLTAVLSPFPGVGLAMIAVGGVIGGAIGGVAGLDKATEDDSVDLPTIKEYELLVKKGRCLVVMVGNHDEVTRASKLISHMPLIHSHIHRLKGHEFHEHPKHRETE